MITELTPEQIAQFPAYVAKWTAIGLSCEPCKKEDTESAIRDLYEVANLPIPQQIVFVPSPAVGALASSISSKILGSSFLPDVVKLLIDGDGKKVTAKKGKATTTFSSAKWRAEKGITGGNKVGTTTSPLHLKVADIIYQTITPTMDSVVDTSVNGANLDTKVSEEVYQGLIEAVDEVISESLKSGKIQWHYWFAGSLWAGYAGYLDFMNNLSPKCVTKAGNAYIKSVTSGGYLWLNKNFAMYCDRPKEINLDENGRLHNETGMAISYRDGWGIYSWHGVTIPEDVITQPQTLKKIEDEENNDIRAIRIERYGWVKYLTDSGAKLIHNRIHPRENTPENLYEVKDGQHRLVVIDPATAKPLALGVPRDIMTCEDAQKWLSHGFDAHAICRT